MYQPNRTTCATALASMLLALVLCATPQVTRAQAVNASGVAAALVDAFKAAGTAAPPSVDAAQGPTSSGFSPIGTGDNLLEFRKRVTALKNYYQDARKYLGTDDAVRIGGYISKLEALEIDFISAYPIGEVEYFTVQINLVDRILSQTYQLIRDAGGWVKYAATIIQLRIEIERTRRNLISSGGSSVRQADATTAPGTLDGLAGAEALASVNGGVDAALAALVGNEDLIARVVQEAEAVNEIVFPWAVSEGPIAPMRLAIDLLTFTTDGIRAMNMQPIPATLLNMAAFGQGSVLPGAVFSG